MLIDGGGVDPDLELENDSDLRRCMIRILWAGSDNACIEGALLRRLSSSDSGPAYVWGVPGLRISAPLDAWPSDTGVSGAYL